MSEEYDLVVIGGGSGGLTAAIIGGRVGARTLLVDKTALGGDCLHWGCVPSKALIASARLAQRMRRAEEFGIGAVDVRPDIRAVMARIRAVREQIAAGESVAVLEGHGVEVAFGGASFLGPHALRVGEREVSARKVIIATGSHPRIPSTPGLDKAGYLTNETVFELAEDPGRLLVLGGGPVGCELGQALHRLGARTTIVQRGARLLPQVSAEAAGCVATRLLAEGVTVLTGAEVERFEQGRALLFDGSSIPFDTVLVATGRAPNLAGLDLVSAGVAFSAAGITVDDALRTSQAHVFAVGDCTGGPKFTHWAEREGRVAARNALFRGHEKRSLTNVPAVTFTEPEVAQVGLDLGRAQARDPKAHALRVPFEHVDRAVCSGDPEGFIEVVVDRRDRVLGVEIVGPEAGEVLTEWVMAIEHAITVAQVGSLVHAYPTLSRANRRIADERFFREGVGWLARLAKDF